MRSGVLGAHVDHSRSSHGETAHFLGPAGGTGGTMEGRHPPPIENRGDTAQERGPQRR